jgi:F420-dependent oxidoreductase-like protein
MRARAGYGRLARMELRIFTEPQQGATYGQLLRVAQAAEDLGYGAFFRSDHYLAMNSDGLPGPTDAWITLAGLARETSTIRLGTLVTSATFRYPGPLAISVAQVDAMSEGRVEFGIGAGWYEEEHLAYGIPFPSLKERFDRLEESLAVITGMWETPVGDSFSFDGAHHRIEDSPALPKPFHHAGPPIIMGGMGKRRTPELTARYADEFNLPFVSLEGTATQFERVRQACRVIDRDPTELTYSNALVLCCGRTESELAARAARIGREVAELRENGAAGSPAELVDKIGRYGELGASRIYLQTLDLEDLDHLELVANEVLPQLG